MKKILLIASMLFAYNADAQLNYEHSYSNYYSVWNLQDEGYKYMVDDRNAKQIKLYNADHSLWKTISLTMPGNVSGYAVTHLSTKLFDNDSELEYILTYTVAGSPGSYNEVVIREESGNTIKTFTNYSGGSVIKFNSDWKFIITNTGTKETEVYGLPGTMPAMVKTSVGTFTETALYPNPIEGTSTLKYRLPDGTNTATLTIYDNNGIKLRNYTITSQFDNITIEKGNLIPGTYVYRIIAPGVSESSAFVIR